MGALDRKIRFFGFQNRIYQIVLESNGLRFANCAHAMHWGALAHLSPVLRKEKQRETAKLVY